MTVNELIAQLEQYDGSLEVMVQGYEGGLTPCNADETSIHRDVNLDEWWFGPHEECSHYCRDVSLAEKVVALYRNFEGK